MAPALASTCRVALTAPVVVTGAVANGRLTAAPSLSTYWDHPAGGCRMGTDPATSVVNPWLQSWDLHNLFVIGASNFPQNASYNPTDTVGALAYRTADAIVKRYVPRPGPLA